MSIIREVTIADKTISFEFQKFAKQANGSVMVTCGGTQVLVTVCAASSAPDDIDFFPLGVDYIEKSYATGRIPGGFLKREGKPSDLATLSARVLDRPLRPCFPKEFRHETVVTATVVSYEHGNAPAPLALAGASTALMISDIPFNGPVAGLRLGLKDGEYIVDPPEGFESDLDLNIACKPDAVLMVEAGANLISEEEMLKAINYAHEVMKPLFDFQEEIKQEIGKEKMQVVKNELPEDLVAKVRELAMPLLSESFQITEKKLRNQALSDAKNKVLGELDNQDGSLKADIEKAWDKLKSEHVRTMVLQDKKRIDGRGLEDIRPISCEINVLKRSHGSSLFTRGETQALASVTLASLDECQRTETLWNIDEKERFMLHYNFPPFCVGEARMQRSPGRREIGHGTLARKALVPVVPSIEEFGYTIRLVSETLESNGSSSMAAVCSGTMALMNAGVPIKEPVAGIAMGLIKEGEQFSVLSDILGDEDHLGDMDFKVCGTKNGISALQMDIKIGGITKEIMTQALDQAKRGRHHILGKISEAIETNANDVSNYAPRIFKLKIKPDKIRDLIGPGGKNIKKLGQDTGAKIDIDDSGLISIVAPNAASAQAAKTLIRSSVTNPQVGEIYLGKAVRLTDFGAFIELKPGVDGLCHLTQLTDQKVKSTSDVLKLGDEVLVKIIDIDRQGRIKLSRKEAVGQKPTFEGDAES